MSTHAKLSPSGAERWMLCPGSVALEDGIVDEGSQYAQEGTAAHFLAAYCLDTKTNPHEHRGRRIALWYHPESESHGEDFFDALADNGEVTIINEFMVDEEMATHVATYVDTIRAMAGSSPLLVEQRLSIEHLTNEPGAKGTTDAVILHPEELHVNDLKYGKGVRVEAERNKQLMTYGLAALREFEMLGDFKRVRFTIHQPRLDHVSEWDCSIEELLAFGEEVKARANMVRDAITLYGRGVRDEGWAKTYLQPGEDRCRFCKAKGSCPKLRDHVLTTVTDSFVNLDEPIAPVIEAQLDKHHDNAVLANLLGAVDLIETWCKAIRSQADSELRAGREVPGYKLVQGRKGARSWSNETEVEGIFKSMRLKTDDMYTMKLITPPKAEELLKEKPKCWKRVLPFISQAEGGLSVAPVSDKRPAVVVQVENFEPVPELETDLAGLV